MSLGYCCAHLRQIEEIPHETIASPCPCRHSSRGCCASSSGCPHQPVANANAAGRRFAFRPHQPVANANAAGRRFAFRPHQPVAYADAAGRRFAFRPHQPVAYADAAGRRLAI
jgi:hypothetical protein